MTSARPTEDDACRQGTFRPSRPHRETGLSRSARLLDLIQALRRRRRAVAASDLAAELGVSLRTIYRDIATLQAAGAPIVGEAGLGYVLRPGFFLPPLAFGPDELDALILGLRLVAARGDRELGAAADDALAKIVAVLPPGRGEEAEACGLLAAPACAADPVHLGPIRRAIRAERKLALRYADRDGAVTGRIVWPVAVGFFEAVAMLAAWCETRQDFRHFRLDRILAVEPLPVAWPRRRRVLLAEWRAAHGPDRPTKAAAGN